MEEVEPRRRTVTINPKEKKIELNENNKRVIANWCQYAKFLKRQQLTRERERRKRAQTVSSTTQQDAEIFQEALERLREIRAEHRRQRATYTCCAKRPGTTEQRRQRPTKTLTLRRVKSLNDKVLSSDRHRRQSQSVKSSRTLLKKSKSRKSIESRSRTKSHITRQRPATRSRSRSKSKTRSKSAAELELGRVDTTKSSVKDSQQQALKSEKKVSGKVVIRYPPIKRKAWISPHLIAPQPKPKKKPVIVIPPLKTRPWNPCELKETKPAKREIPKIKYPPLKMRKAPPSPPAEKVEKPKLKKKLKLFSPPPQSTLEKSWNEFKLLEKNLYILRGTISQFSKKFNYRSNGKQSAFIAAVALVQTQFIPMKLWTASDLDEIVNYGDINFRRQVKRAAQSIRPPEIKLKIYTRRTKTSTEIGIETRSGCFDPSSSSSVLTCLDEILAEFGAAIFTCCGSQSFAIWKDENSFYIFNSLACDEAGNRTEKLVGCCCVLRSCESLKPILDHIGMCCCNENQSDSAHYEIFSFKINSKILCFDDSRKAGELDDKVGKVDHVDEPEEVEHKSPDEAAAAVQLQPTSFLTTLFESQPEPPFAEHFHKQLEEHESSRKVQGYLECDEFLTDSSVDKQVALLVACTTIAMTKMSKASSWRSSRMSEIFRLGAMLFGETSAASKAPIVTEIIEPIVELRNEKYRIMTQNRVFGRINLRSGQDTLSLLQGLRKMFREHDAVILKGFEPIAIWREAEKYFMLDPFACDGLRGLRRSKEQRGKSCILFFDSLEDLSEHYIENIDKKFRNSVYKLASIEIFEHHETQSNWQEFKSIGVDKWILRGNFSESSSKFKSENYGFQSTAMSVTAIAKTRILGIQNWTSQIVDEILTIGADFFRGAILELKNSGKFVDNNVKLAQHGSVLRLQTSLVDLSYDESVIAGDLNEMRLNEALKKFFDDDDAGIITIDKCPLAIWKIGETFYMFDSHDRDEKGRNVRIFDATSNCIQSGKACVLRFMKVDDLTKHIIANVEITDSTTFNIAKVEAEVHKDDPPCLFNYQKLDENSAILHAGNNFSEELDTTHPNSISKTCCNLISCVCFAQILNPLHWKPEDVNEVIHFGAKILCQIGKVDMENLNETFKEIEVAGHKFKIEFLHETDGTFIEKTFKKRLTDEKIITKESLDEIEERKSGTSELTKPSYVSSGLELDNIPEPKTLKDHLENFNFDCALVISRSMQLAIFKSDRLHFIFDANSSGIDGRLTRARVHEAFRKFLHDRRDKGSVKFASSTPPQRPSADSQHNEVVHGRPLDMPKVNLKPSLEYIASNSFRADNVDDDDDDTTTLDDFPTKGGAYIGWFRSHDQLRAHIMAKIPSRFHHDHFTLKYFQVTKSVDEGDNHHLVPWRNFQPILRDHWILRANIAQSDTQFCQLSRDNQAIPNCILALTFAQLLCFDGEMGEWSTALIDIILKLGDRLYRRSIAKQQRNSNAGHVSKLTLKEIDFPLFIRPFIVRLVDEALVMWRDSMAKSSDKSPLESFKKHISELDGQLMISARDYTVAVWRDGEFYYMFDPHTTGPNGYRSSLIGTASIQRFGDHRLLIDTFYRNVRQLEGSNEYQVTKISIVKTHYQDDDDAAIDEQSDLLAHSLFRDGVGKVRMISASIKQPMHDDIAMVEICYAIAAICISRTLSPEFYTREIVDTMLELGGELVRECRPRPDDELNWNFVIDRRHFHAQLNIVERGVISMLPCPAPQFRKAFEEFFDNFSVGILITDSFTAAVWNEGGIHFVFYARDVNEDGKLTCRGVLDSVEALLDKIIVESCDSKSNRSTPSLIAFHTLRDLCDNIFDNLDKSLKCQKFEIRSCSLAITDVEDSCDRYGEMDDDDDVEVTIPAISCDILRDIGEARESQVDDELDELRRAVKLKTKGFIKFKNYRVLVGKLSSNSNLFDEASRENQTSAITLISIAQAHLTKPDCWNAETLDNVIVSGNQLYLKSQSASKSDAISLENLIKSITLANCEFVFKVKSIQSVPATELDLHQLCKTLDELLNCFSEGFVRLDRHYWTVFQRENSFFLFDPRGMKLKTAKHRAVLLKFRAIDQLAEQMIQIITARSRIESETEIGTVLYSCRRRMETDEKKF